MNTNLTTTDKGDTGAASISLRLLGGLFIAFLLGFAAYGLVRNAISGTPLSFSTPELINFVLSVLLSGASIFLAIAAIALGKYSEQAIMQRSDESIRLQNEVFLKTTDALQRIESSTGVTEKRIEDIISGRVGDLSQKIARFATEQQETEGKLGIKEIEDMVKQSIYQSLGEEGLFGGRLSMDATRQREKEAVETRRKQKREFDEMSSRMLSALSSRDDLKAIKIGRGDIGGAGDELYDGIFLTKDGKKLGVIDFASYHSPAMIKRGVLSVLEDLNAGNVACIWVVIYDATEMQQKAFGEVVSMTKPELSARMTLTPCAAQGIENITKCLSFANNAVVLTGGPPSGSPAAHS